MVIPSGDFKIFSFKDISHDSLSDSSLEATNSSITVKATSTWTHCGPLLDLASLPPSFHKWTKAGMNGDLVPYLLPFLSFVHDFLADRKLDHYWLTIRATRATHDFDQARWHTDLPFFNRKNSESGDWKLCTTLVGPGTVLLVDGAKGREAQRQARTLAKEKIGLDHECTTMRCIGCSDMEGVVRNRLKKELETLETVQTAAGECVFLRVGDRNGAIHSEPPSPCDRVFVSVLPGSEAELTMLAKRWGMKFPRAWSLGVPLDYEE